MAKRGIRRHLTRNRSIALGVAVIAFVVVGLGFADIGINVIQSGGFEGTSFSVTIFENIIPLAFIQNFALDCAIWTESELTFIDGTTRFLGRSEAVFTQTQFLALFDPISQKEVKTVDGVILARCSSPTPIESFKLLGGSVEHFITVEKTDDGKTRTLGFTPQTLSGSTSLLKPVGSTGGILLKSFSFSGDLINDAIATNDFDYFVKVRLFSQIRLDVEARAGGMVDTKTANIGLGSFSSPPVTLRISNTNTNNPSVVGLPVIITDHQNTIPGRQSEFRLDDSVQELFLEVQLPQYQSFESLPIYKINQADPSTGKTIGATLLSGNVNIQVSSDKWAQFIDFTNKLAEGVYITTASSNDRQTDSMQAFVVYDQGQSGSIPIPPETPDTTDPCEGLSTTDPSGGNPKKSCEQAKGDILSCFTGYTKFPRDFYDIVASTPAVIVNIQPGTSVNDFTTQVCISDQTIELFNSLGGAQCSDPNFIFDDSAKKCVCGFTGSTDTEAACSPDAQGTLSAKSLMLYEIAYNGASDVGSIRDIQGADVVFGPLLSLAGQIGEKEELFAMARLQVNPIIDWNDVDPIFGDPKKSIFIFKWTGALTRVGTEEKVALGKPLEICLPNGFDPNKDFQDQSLTLAPSTSCDIFNMNTVGVVTGGGNLGLRVEDDIQGGRFYQIARSDVQPSEIISALNKQNIVLKDGDKFEITVEVEGSFQVGENTLKRIGVVTPMTFSHEFTWVEALNPEPCSGLSGEDKIRCLGGSFDAGGTCSAEENDGVQLTALECYRLNNPVLPKTNPSDPDCRQTFVAGLIKIVCEGDPDPKKNGGLGGDPDDGSKGDPGELKTCASGSTATECLELTILDLQKQISSILGLSGNTITTLSNNAVLIIGVVVVIIIIAVIVQRTAAKSRQRKLGRSLLGI